MKTQIIEDFDIRDLDGTKKGIAAYRGAEDFDGGAEHLIIRHGIFRNVAKCIELRRWPKVSIYDVRTESGEFVFAEKWARGIRIGNSNDINDGCGIVEIEDITIDNLGPSNNGNYGAANADNIVIERGTGHVMMKRFDLKGATDACIDAKSPITAVNGTLGPAYRQWRIWSGVVARRAAVRFRPPANYMTWFNLEKTPRGKLEWLDLKNGADPFFDSERYLTRSGEVLYVVLDRTHADYDWVLNDLQTRHNLPSLDRIFSINYAQDGVRCLVKVDAMPPSFRAGNYDEPGGAVLDVIPPEEHQRAEALIYDPSW